ncbi:MAG: response regulator [Candidatus Altiarchaeota archaeon]|nr:response regulator [Candidatus Altiarchaeota archaeon]
MESKVLIITLVVDDYAPLREAAVEILRSKGFRNIFEAETPEEGMDLVREHKPDLVILDIIMPSIRGIDLIDDVKKISPETKVVMLSVLSGEATIQESMTKGADLYLVKPLTPTKVDEIKKVLRVQT